MWLFKITVLNMMEIMGMKINEKKYLNNNTQFTKLLLIKNIWIKLE